MSRARAAWPCAAAVSILLPAALAAGTLEVATDEATLVSLQVADGDGWCLRWNHSVTGGAVADCFVNDDGRMVLDRSYLHDFAAGLGEVPGRGTLHPAKGGGYWIEDMGEPIADNALTLRIGQPRVDHRLTARGETYPLSARAPGRRAVIRLIP